MNPKISVIVPVYKAETYLRRCVNSILAQTFQDFEVLLIDDGSPDKSGEICDEYAKKDSRVRVFHKENGGVSSARQCGIDNALGEYTIHADPDDWVEPNMLEELYKKAKKEDADMVICDYYTEGTNTGKIRYVQQKPSSLDHDTVLKELFQQLHGSCCNKLVRRACYKKYDVKFPLEISYCEDLYVNVVLLMYNIKVSYLNEAFYHYTQDININSLSKTYNIESYFQDKKKLQMFLKLLEFNKHYESCRQFMVVNLVRRAYEMSNYSSVEFKQLMYEYRTTIKNSEFLSFKYKFLLYFSCVGYYKYMYKILQIKKKLWMRR